MTDRLVAAVVLMSTIIATVSMAQEERWFEIDALMPPASERPNLATPQASVESFMMASRDEDFSLAGQSLDLRLAGDTPDAAALAEKLAFVLQQELWIDWESLPDRPDGVVEPGPLGEGGPLVGVPRRSIRLGDIAIDGREVPIRVHRVKAPNQDPIWLFSAQTVDNIDALYEAHGPSWVARAMPAWASGRVWGVQLWQVVALAATLAAAPGVGWIVGIVAYRRLRSTLPERLCGVAAPVRWPIAAVASTVMVWIIVEWLLPLPSAIAAIADLLALIGVVAAAAWLTMRLIDLFVNHVAKDAITNVHEDESPARQRMLTQVTIARYACMLIVVLVGISVVLIQLDLFRSVGIALLTSAGAAAVVIGIAGHAVLGNLIAGLQIALSQPIKIGDTVIVLDNWGAIEDITYTYVVVRTWDERRLVVPINHFVSDAIENWSKTDTFLVKPIYLRLDYRADVDRVRETFFEFVREDEDWDEERDEPEVLVTDSDDEAITVRLTCGGATPSAAWSLHCRVREKMFAWLRDVEGGLFLPERRVRLRGTEGGVPALSGEQAESNGE